MSAFYISKTGIYRFFVNNGKLVDPLFYLIKENCIILHSFHGTCPRQDESIETKQASGQDKSVLIDEMPIEMGSGNDMVEHSMTENTSTEKYTSNTRICIERSFLRTGKR